MRGESFQRHPEQEGLPETSQAAVLSPEQEPIGPQDVEAAARELAQLRLFHGDAQREAGKFWNLSKSAREELRERGSDAVATHLDALGRDPEIAQFHEDIVTGYDDRIKELEANPEVAKAYQGLVGQARSYSFEAISFERLRRERDAIDSSLQKLEPLFEKIGRAPLPLEQQKLAELEARRSQLDREMNEMELSPEAIDILRRLEVRRLQRDLTKYNFGETESRTELIREVLPDLLQGAPVLFQGETGSGKTQLAKYISERYLKQTPALIPISEQIKESQIMGARGLQGGETVFNYSEFVKAQKEGRPVILDEVNLMPHEFAGILHDLLQKRVGDIWKHPVTGEEIPIRAPIFATANLKSERYKQRYELDVATLRRFVGGAGAREIHFLDIGKKDASGQPIAPETLKILAAVLADRRGNIPWSEEEAPEKLDELRRFVAACRKIQEDFTLSVREGAEETLSRSDRLAFKELVITLKDQIEIAKAWKASGFREPLDEVVLREFFHKAEISGRASKDRENMARVFIANKFFADTPPEKFKIQGLEAKNLRAWQGKE